MSDYERWKRETAYRAFVQSSNEQMRARIAAETRRRSVGEMAQAVADSMVSRASADYPDVFRGRNTSGLVGLIRGWILGGE